MAHYLRFVAVPMALVLCAQVQAQTPEIDALHARAEAGDAEAQFDLGYAYFGGEGVPQDEAAAAWLVRLAADQGNATAQFNLGVMYDTDAGVPQDDGETLKGADQQRAAVSPFCPTPCAVNRRGVR